MTPGKPVDPVEVVAVDALLSEQLLGIVAGQVAQRESTEQATHAHRPARHRGFTAGEDDARVVLQRANEGLLEPEVDRAQDLVAIQDEDDSIAEAPQARRGIFGGREVAARRTRDCGQEAARRGFDRARIEEEDDRAAPSRLGRERLDER